MTNNITLELSIQEAERLSHAVNVALWGSSSFWPSDEILLSLQDKLNILMPNKELESHKEKCIGDYSYPEEWCEADKWREE